MSGIEIEHLTKTFSTTRAVDDVSLTIDDGEFVVLLGPSGCGKSTLLRMIAGLIEPTAGRVRVGGRDITDLPAAKRDLAMVFQSYALYPHLSVAKNLAFPLGVRHLSKAEVNDRVQRVAEQLGLGELLARKPKQLSGGQRQRVAVGRALVRHPAAFLMDEPLSNLDAKLRAATRRDLTELHHELGATFLYVTHDQVEAMTMATRIVLLNQGRLEQVGTPEDIYDRPESVFVAGFMGSPPMNLLPATVAAQAGRIQLRARGLSGQLWTGQCESFDAVVGVRPEHLRVVPFRSQGADDAEGLRLDVQIDAVESLGSEEVAYASCGEVTVAVRGVRPLPVSLGDHFSLVADAAQVHLFDQASGRRLTWVPDASLAPTPDRATL